MADFGVGEISLAVAAISAATAAAQGISGVMQAHKQAAVDQTAYNNNVVVAHQNSVTAQTATNQNEVQAEQKAIVASSQREARADQQLGTLRVQASAGSASQSSYNALMEQSSYSEGSDLNTVQTQYGNTITSMEEDKAQSRTDYSNSTKASGIQLESQVNRTNAASTSSLLGAIGSGLSIGSNYEAGVTRAQSSSDAYNQAMKNLAAQRAAN